VANIVEAAVPGVVNISSSRFGHEASLGSGIIISKDGDIITNHHVVDGAELVEVTFSDGRAFTADVTGVDRPSDLAVLKIRNPPAELTVLPLGTGASLRLGDQVLAIGNPFGVGQTVTQGIVSAKGRADLGIVDYEDFIQTDAAINPGNSGGALVSRDGKLVGINTAILSRTGGYQGISFAIPTEMAMPIARELIAHGKVSRGFLGVGIMDLTPRAAEAMGLSKVTGVLIGDVGEDTPAERAGLEVRDVVLSIDGEATPSAGKLRNYIALAGPRGEVRLQIVRGHRHFALKARLEELKKVEDRREIRSELDAFAPRSSPSGLEREPSAVRAFRSMRRMREA
jgi:S1-C subfamily serine protease